MIERRSPLYEKCSVCGMDRRTTEMILHFGCGHYVCLRACEPDSSQPCLRCAMEETNRRNEEEVSS